MKKRSLQPKQQKKGDIVSPINSFVAPSTGWEEEKSEQDLKKQASFFDEVEGKLRKGDEGNISVLPWAKIIVGQFEPRPSLHWLLSYCELI